MVAEIADDFAVSPPNTDIYHTATQESVFLREALRRIRTLPGVEETAASDRAALPLGHGQIDLRQRPLIREGQDVQRSQLPLIDMAIVSPEYFHVLGMTLLRGRLFADQDIEDTPSIAIINQAAARTYWPNQDPVGKRVIFRSRAAKPGWTTIVGVIADARTESLADAGIPQMYFDIYQRPAKFLAAYLRGQVDPAVIQAQVRTQIQSVDAELPVFHAETLDDVLSSSLSVRRFSMEMVALLPAQPCCSRLWESMEPSPSWSMSNRARSRFASRWARKGAISSRWFYTRASPWPLPA